MNDFNLYLKKKTIFTYIDLKYIGGEEITIVLLFYFCANINQKKVKIMTSCFALNLRYENIKILSTSVSIQNLHAVLLQ